MPISRYCLLAAALGLLSPSHALAQGPRWFVQAQDQGACGEECFTPTTAWVYEPGGNFGFGVQCGGTMVLGGPAMAQPTPPFSSVEMVVDGRSYGRFDVQNGLNDVYVRPTVAGGVQDWARSVRPALAAGATLQLWLGPGALLEFGLSGSRAALDSLDFQCAAGASVPAPPPGPAPTGPVGGQPTSPSTPAELRALIAGNTFHWGVDSCFYFDANGLGSVDGDRLEGGGHEVWGTFVANDGKVAVSINAMNYSSSSYQVTFLANGRVLWAPLPRGGFGVVGDAWETTMTLGNHCGATSLQRQYFADYMVTCLENVDCEARTSTDAPTSGGGTPFRTQLNIVRAGFPGTAWILSFNGAFEGPVPGTPIRVSIGRQTWNLAFGEGYGQIGGLNFFPWPVNDQIFLAMRAGSAMDITQTISNGASQTVRYSLRGLNDAMAWIDQIQGRIGEQPMIGVPWSVEEMILGYEPPPQAAVQPNVAPQPDVPATQPQITGPGELDGDTRWGVGLSDPETTEGGATISGAGVSVNGIGLELTCQPGRGRVSIALFGNFEQDFFHILNLENRAADTYAVFQDNTFGPYLSNYSGYGGSVSVVSGILPQDEVIENLMNRDMVTVTVVGSPFEFPLATAGSKAAICTMMRQCGLSRTGC